MGKKTVKYTKKDISNLPNDKPVVYKILTSTKKNNYTGKAKRGRVQERITEHLGQIPGAKVRIEQMPNIIEAGKKELNVISRTKPKYNKKGKSVN